MNIHVGELLSSTSTCFGEFFVEIPEFFFSYVPVFPLFTWLFSVVELAELRMNIVNLLLESLNRMKTRKQTLKTENTYSKPQRKKINVKNSCKLTGKFTSGTYLNASHIWKIEVRAILGNNIC